MTEQEAIEQFKERLAIEEYRQQIPKYYEAMELAVKSLEEIQQYRAIGTVKEIKIREAQAKRLSEGYLTNLGILREYQSIGTPEEIKEELDHLRNDNDCQGLYFTLEERQDLARQHRELEEYRAIGTVEELQKAEKEEDILKFYYCDSEDSYLVGLRIGNFYYAHYIDGRWVFDMSRYLPWGEHVVDDKTAWKEHTYPSEPKEINFSEWLNGFVKKECGGTPEECGAAVEKQKAKKPIIKYKRTKDCLTEVEWKCPTCEANYIELAPCGEWCRYCGTKFDWSDKDYEQTKS